MSINTMPLGGPSMAGLTLRPHAVAVPALASHVRPALVLAEQDARRLLDAARNNEVSRGGRFSCSPAGVQVWDGPWDAPDLPGSALHLGSVDWSYDTPVKHYVTIYRAMVTAAGVENGVSTETILKAVLDLTGIPLDGARVTMAIPPPRDPFRR